MIQVDKVVRKYGEGEAEVLAVNDVSLSFEKGEFTAVVGPSGSGKSTLLNMMSGLDVPTAGSVAIGGKKISEMSGTELSDFRRDHIGFIFQSYNLIPVLSAAENVEYILLLQGVSPAERKERVSRILEEVGLGELKDRRPGQLSGGQQQRVAVARAIVSDPDLILADEPTANLDSTTGSALIDLMQKLNQDKGTTFVFSTHDSRIMERAKRLVTLTDGRVHSDEKR